MFSESENDLVIKEIGVEVQTAAYFSSIGLRDLLTVGKEPDLKVKFWFSIYDMMWKSSVTQNFLENQETWDHFSHIFL